MAIQRPSGPSTYWWQYSYPGNTAQASIATSSNVNSTFALAVGPYTSGPVQAVTFYDSWTLDRNIDDGASLSFNVPGNSPEAGVISELDTDVFVYLNGTLVQRFRIVEVGQSWGPSGEDTVSVQAVDYRRLLASRYVVSPLAFENVSQGDIIWGLIDHTQSQTNGDLGIVQGLELNPVIRSRSYEVGQNILDAIVDLTRADGGPVWEITEQLDLNVKVVNEFPLNPTPVVLGITAQSLNRPSGAAKFANAVVVSGAQAVTTPVIVESSTLPTDPRGRWERRVAYVNTVQQVALETQAYGLISDYQAPSAVWQVEVVPERYFGDAEYAIGEFVRLVQPESLVAPLFTPATEVVGQVIAMQIRQTASGDVSISMRVLEVGDEVPPLRTVEVTGESSDVMDGDYRVVTWESSGTITVSGVPIQAEYLVVGGGGAGGTSGLAGSGGGGGGGLKTNFGGTKISVSGVNAIVVGAGAPSTSTTTTPPVQGQAGTGSSLGLLVSVSGGGGGGGGSGTTLQLVQRQGGNGGSGGGAGGVTTSELTPGGLAIPGEGKDGGSKAVSGAAGGHGGGGASTIGVSSTGDNGGNGGAGLSVAITGSAVTYAGGGGGGRYRNTGTGGTGGTGGGGNGGTNDAGTSGTDGRGGGGGGAGYSGTTPIPNGGPGGDGVVILRWLP